LRVFACLLAILVVAISGIGDLLKKKVAKRQWLHNIEVCMDKVHPKKKVREITDREIMLDIFGHLLARLAPLMILVLVGCYIVVMPGFFVINSYRAMHVCGAPGVWPTNSESWGLNSPYNLSAYNLDNMTVSKSIAVGLHNTYHQYGPLKDVVAEWGYANPRFTDLLNKGMREIEIDIHYDPDSGQFHVYHLQMLDQASSCICLSYCLQEIKNWSDNNPGHSWIWVWIEPRGFATGDLWCDRERYAQEGTDTVMTTINDIFGDKILLPETVRGNFSSMQEALKTNGWPTNGELYGKIIFAWNVFMSNKQCMQFYHNSTKKHVLFERAAHIDHYINEPTPYTCCIEATAVDDAYVDWNVVVRKRWDGAPPETTEEVYADRSQYVANLMDYSTSPIENSMMKDSQNLNQGTQ